jgi:hypothetical protein
MYQQTEHILTWLDEQATDVCMYVDGNTRTIDELERESVTKVIHHYCWDRDKDEL